MWDISSVSKRNREASSGKHSHDWPKPIEYKTPNCVHFFPVLAAAIAASVVFVKFLISI